MAVLETSGGHAGRIKNGRASAAGLGRKLGTWAAQVNTPVRKRGFFIPQLSFCIQGAQADTCPAAAASALDRIPRQQNGAGSVAISGAALSYQDETCVYQARYFGHQGCQQTNNDGYHFPSAQQRCMVQPAGPQAAVFNAPGVQAAAGAPFFLPFAIESPAEPAIASAATAAASASFDTNFFMIQLPREMR